MGWAADGRTNPRTWRKCPHLDAVAGRCSGCGAYSVTAPAGRITTLAESGLGAAPMGRMIAPNLTGTSTITRGDPNLRGRPITVRKAPKVMCAAGIHDLAETGVGNGGGNRTCGACQRARKVAKKLADQATKGLDSLRVAV